LVQRVARHPCLCGSRTPRLETWHLTTFDELVETYFGQLMRVYSDDRKVWQHEQIMK
jgi:hypothetical protein